MDSALIDEFERGGQLLAKSIAGLSREELTGHPIPGKWSIQQVVIHMQDSDSIAIDRMKRVIAQDKPLLIGYDETAFSKELFNDDQDINMALQIFDLNRRQFAKVLRKISADRWEKWGVHNERGKVTLAEFVKMYVWHLGHHLTFIQEKRAKLGKPLSL